MVLCQIQKTHEKLKSENKNLLKTNCSHLLCSSEGNVTVKRHRTRKTGGGRMVSFEAPPSTLTEMPSWEGLASWRSLVVACFFVVIVFNLLKWIHKGNLNKDFAEQLSGFCSTCPVSLQTHWQFVECVVLHLTWNKLFLTKGQISERKSRREFWPWNGVHLRTFSWI